MDNQSEGKTYLIIVNEIILNQALTTVISCFGSINLECSIQEDKNTSWRSDGDEVLEEPTADQVRKNTIIYMICVKLISVHLIAVKNPVSTDLQLFADPVSPSHAD